MKSSEISVVALVCGIIMGGVVWRIGSQLDDIKLRSFRMGCMDSGKVNYATCTELATLYVDGKLDKSKLEKYNAR